MGRILPSPDERPVRILFGGRYRWGRAGEARPEPVTEFRTDVAGNPTEFRCPESLLKRIRDARDEAEARNLKARRA